MAKLKPIGSEKLQGQAKINRMLEIAMYKENTPKPINETNRIDYGIEMADNFKYFIAKEKNGYVIKRGLNESTADYIEPMKNRKYYRGYADALKKINLIAKEVNSLNNVKEQLALFGEQKKYTLKTPQPPAPAPVSAVPDAPPAVPEPELPPSPTEMPSDAPAGDEMGGLDLGGAEAPLETPEAPAAEEEPLTFKSLQKIVGKLTQKTRLYDREEGLTSDEIKYLINMVISAVDLNNLEAEDKEDILSRFEPGEEMAPDMMGGEEEMPMEEPPAEEMPPSEPMESMYFGESKIDKIISQYYEYSDSEKKLNESRLRKNEILVTIPDNKVLNRINENKTFVRFANKRLKLGENIVTINEKEKNKIIEIYSILGAKIKK